MLKLSVKTKVDPLTALDRATKYFEERYLRCCDTQPARISIRELSPEEAIQCTREDRSLIPSLNLERGLKA
jgi:hypothetical protein